MTLGNVYNDEFTLKYSEHNFSLSASYKQESDGFTSSESVIAKSESEEITENNSIFVSKLEEALEAEMNIENCVEVTSMSEKSKGPISPNKFYQSPLSTHFSSSPSKRPRSKSLSTVNSEQSTTFILLDMSDDEDTETEEDVYYDDCGVLYEGDEDI